MRNTYYLLFFLLLATVSCTTQTSIEERAFIDNEWYIGNDVIFRDAYSVSYTHFDAQRKEMVGDTLFPISITDSTITYTLIKGVGKYNKNRQYELIGDTTITATVGYDFKVKNNKSYLVLYAENYPKVCTSQKKDLNIKETNNYEQTKFRIASKYTIGETIDRELVKTRGIYNYDTYTIEDCELITNRDIKIKIIGYNYIYAIEQHNIPHYRIKDIVKVVSSKLNQEAVYVPARQLSETSDYAYEFYSWNKNGVRIKLERSHYIGDYAYMNLLDTDTWNLYYDDDVQKSLLIEQHKSSKPQSTIIN
ncbi:MAG: hypothetical protein R6U85_06250 [Salinivirgaceae bacterium]